MIELRHIKQIKRLSERNGRVITKLFNYEADRFLNNKFCKMTKELLSGRRYNIFNELGTVKMFEIIYLEETEQYYIATN